MHLLFWVFFKELWWDLNVFLVLADASFKHQYPTRLCQWKGRRAEFYTEPQFVSLYLPERAWAAHWKAVEPQRDINGSKKAIVQWEILHLRLFPQCWSIICSLQSLYNLFQALHYMLLVSEVEETEIFKICLEYWNHLAAELYRESPFSTSTSPLLSGNQHFDVPPRRQLYLPVLSKVPP